MILIIDELYFYISSGKSHLKKPFKMKEINFLKLLKRLMIVSGIWRLPLRTKLLRDVYKVYSFIFQFNFILFTTAMAVEFPIVWNIDSDKVIESLGVLILCIIMVIKTWICQTDKVQNLVAYILKKEEEIKELDDEEVNDLYISYSRHSIKISWVIIIHTSIVGWSLVLTVFTAYMQMEGTLNNDTVVFIHKPLPYLTWFPFDTDEHYAAAFLFHTFCGATSGCIYNITTAVFFVSIMIFAGGQLKILQHSFRNLVINEDCDVTFQVLRTLIIEHQNIIKYVETFNSSVNIIILVDFTLISVQLASLIFQLIAMEPNIIMIFTIIYLGLMVLQIFVLTWNANEIKEQSLNISDAIYENLWYEQPVKIRKMLILIMMRSQKPLTLSLGPFYPMTNNTSLTTMKAAYSYVTLLKRNK